MTTSRTARHASVEIKREADDSRREISMPMYDSDGELFLGDLFDTDIDDDTVNDSKSTTNNSSRYSSGGGNNGARNRRQLSSSSSQNTTSTHHVESSQLVAYSVPVCLFYEQLLLLLLLLFFIEFFFSFSCSFSHSSLTILFRRSAIGCCEKRWICLMLLCAMLTRIAAVTTTMTSRLFLRNMFWFWHGHSMPVRVRLCGRGTICSKSIQPHRKTMCACCSMYTIVVPLPVRLTLSCGHWTHPLLGCL